MSKGESEGAVRFHEEPFYLEFLERLKPEYIEEEVSRLTVTRNKEGQFEAKNSGGEIMGLGLNVVVTGDTREEVIRKATDRVRRNVELFVCEHIFIRRELLRGLPYVEQGIEWLLDEMGFRELLKRVEERGLGIFGIESYESDEVEGEESWENSADVEVYEDYRELKGPRDPRWHISAFEKMMQRNPKARFNCSLDISSSILGFSKE